MKKKALLTALLMGISSPSFAWYCSGVGQPIIQWATPFIARWEAVVGSVGNFQTAMDVSEQTINTALDVMDQYVKLKVQQSESNLSRALTSFVSKVNMQLTNYGTAQIMANTAMAEYENLKTTQEKIDELSNEATQPITNCLQFAAGQTLSQAYGSMKRIASQSALDVAQRAVTNDSEDGIKIREYNEVKKNFVETDDVTIKNGDVNAALIFGGHTGSLTRYLPKQDDASKAFISNIVREYDIPARIGSLQEQSTLGKRYTNLQRRMATYLGLATNSLESVRANHQANMNFVQFYEAAKLTPNENIKKYGVSTAEMLDTYANKMIGAENTAAIAGAGNSTTILRQMAQTNAMRLFVKKQKMDSIERMQALKAAKLALTAEEVLGDEAKTLSGAISQ